MQCKHVIAMAAALRFPGCLAGSTVPGVGFAISPTGHPWGQVFMRLEAGSAPVRIQPVAIDMAFVAKAIASLSDSTSFKHGRVQQDIERQTAACATPCVETA